MKNKLNNSYDNNNKLLFKNTVFEMPHQNNLPANTETLVHYIQIKAIKNEKCSVKPPNKSKQTVAVWRRSIYFDII